MTSSFGSPRRTDDLKTLYFSTAGQDLAPSPRGAPEAVRFWDAFVAKQNARAYETMAQHSPRLGGTALSVAIPGRSPVGGLSSSPRSPRSLAYPTRLAPLSPRAQGIPTRGAPNSSRIAATADPSLSPRRMLPHQALAERTEKKRAMLHARAKAAARAAAEAAANAATAAPSAEEAARKARSLEYELLEKKMLAITENGVNSHFSDMWKAFKYVDVDMSGKVGRKELMRALHMWNVTAPNGDLSAAAQAVIDACDTNGDGEIDYKEFVNGLARDKFAGAPSLNVTTKTAGKDPLADPLAKLRPGVTAQELVDAHTQIREKLTAKHDTLIKAFKFIDTDGSGYIKKSEFVDALAALNVTSVSEACVDSLLDIMDVEDNDDGGRDHDIGFKEFARVMTAADMFKMKAFAPRPAKVDTILDEKEAARQKALKCLRPGVTQEEMRKAQEQIKAKISQKHGKHAYTSAFKWIDADRTGSITRVEFKEALHTLNLSNIRESILDTLCDFIDADHSGSFGYAEFSRVLAADDVMMMAPNLKK